MLDLLKSGESELESQRQAGKSLLDIAAAKGVSEQQLTDALLQPITSMLGWMAQSQIREAQRRGDYPQSNTEQMTQQMRDWIGKDIRETKFGKMTDFRLFGGNRTWMIGRANGMMNGGAASTRLPTMQPCLRVFDAPTRCMPNLSTREPSRAK